MALQSVQQQSRRPREGLRTDAATFRACPKFPDGLLEVRGGQPAEYALTEALCLADSINNLAQGGVDGGLDSETCHLIAFTAETICALVGSAQIAVERAETLGEDDEAEDRS